MKTSLLATALAAYVGLSCSTSGKPPVEVERAVETVADCTKKSVQEVAKTRLTEVEGILASASWQTRLGNLAKDIGIETLACLIDYIVNESRLDARASSDKSARLKVSRGEQWLQENKISFKAN